MAEGGDELGAVKNTKRKGSTTETVCKSVIPQGTLISLGSKDPFCLVVVACVAKAKLLQTEESNALSLE